MAMTKAEKQVVDDLRVRAALCWPAPPPKPVDLLVAQEVAKVDGRKWLRLWWFNANSMEAKLGVVVDGLHSRYDYTDEQLANRYSGGSRVSLSQTSGGPWYASEIDALRALHWAVAQECAKRLALIEDRIAKADPTQ